MRRGASTARIRGAARASKNVESSPSVPYILRQVPPSTFVNYVLESGCVTTVTVISVRKVPMLVSNTAVAGRE